ncbi:MAG: DUF3179 domain-containing (seleno)protein [Armatimonadota bacterium]
MALVVGGELLWRQKSVPDFDPRALIDAREVSEFRALDQPRMVSGAEADFLHDDDYVLGLTLNGESRAYPSRFASLHHAINDQVQGQAVAITYCSMCGTGVGLNPTAGGRTLTFDLYGLYYAVAAVYDRETKSVWTPTTGRAILGPLAGTRLERFPLFDTTWKEWKQLHPDTLVMAPDERFAEHYPPADQPEPRGYPHFPQRSMEASVTRGDRRLSPFEKVLGVKVPVPAGAASGADAVARRAYPIGTLEREGSVVNDQLAEWPIAVFLEPKSVSATAVSRVLNGRTLTFKGKRLPDGRVEIYDRETGTRWSLQGRGEAGPLAGQELASVESHLSAWYGWSAFFPDTSIYRRDDPPQPFGG